MEKIMGKMMLRDFFMIGLTSMYTLLVVSGLSA